MRLLEWKEHDDVRTREMRRPLEKLTKTTQDQSSARSSAQTNFAWRSPPFDAICQPVRNVETPMQQSLASAGPLGGATGSPEARQGQRPCSNLPAFANFECKEEAPCSAAQATLTNSVRKSRVVRSGKTFDRTYHHCEERSFSNVQPGHHTRTARQLSKRHANV
jgi:hypothetical protein